MLDKIYFSMKMVTKKTLLISPQIIALVSWCWYFDILTEKSKIYFVWANTTPDVPHKDQMICHYVDETAQPRERLLSLRPVIWKTGEATADYIIPTLRRSSLDTKEVTFQSYDFTTSTSGHLGGTQRKLQDRLDRIIPYIPC